MNRTRTRHGTKVSLPCRLRLTDPSVPPLPGQSVCIELIEWQTEKEGQGRTQGQEREGGRGRLHGRTDGGENDTFHAQLAAVNTSLPLASGKVAGVRIVVRIEALVRIGL